MLPLPKFRPSCAQAARFRPAIRFLTQSSLPPEPPAKGYAHLTSRRLLALWGQDAPHFLQGLTTRNIAPAGAHTHDQLGGFYSAFLNAAGRVLHDIFIYPGAHQSYVGSAQTPGFLIDVDANEAERLRKHLKRFTLRAKVDVEVLDADRAGLWSSWDTGKNNEPHHEKVIGCRDERVEGMGLRVVLPKGQKPQVEADECRPETYRLRRIIRGVAEGQDEILREAALPLESNMDYMGGIDFRKGCYVGQELTIRTHHTGVVRKRILPIQLYDSARPPDRLQYDSIKRIKMPPQGTDIKRMDGKGRSVGKWLGGVGSLGLALCRLENMTDITLTGESKQGTPEHEFKLAWNEGNDDDNEETVKVKAFVPEWHRNRPSVRDKHRDNENVIIE